MKTILILLDAFRWDYINSVNTPFLYKLSKDNIYVKRVKPSLSYCERTEILSGMKPLKSNNFTAIGYNPDESPYKKYKKIFNVLSIVDKTNIFSRRFRTAINCTLKMFGYKLLTYNIPLDMIYNFNLTEDKKNHFLDGAFNSESIIDVMRRSDKKIYYNSFTALGMENNGDDKNRLNLALKNISEKYDLYLIYIGEIDYCGHYFGTKSSKTINAIKIIDNKLIDFYKKVLRQYPDSKFVFLGDHGMTDVVYKFDFYKNLKNILLSKNILEKKDYIMFLDSTMARIWTFNTKSNVYIRKVLKGGLFKDRGQIIERDHAIELSIPFNNKLYGDIVWLCKKGTLISPDYYTFKNNLCGMHGYDPNDPDSQGFAIINIKNVKKKFLEEAVLVDICPTICDLLEIEYPNGNEGKSLL